MKWIIRDNKRLNPQSMTTTLKFWTRHPIFEIAPSLNTPGEGLEVDNIMTKIGHVFLGKGLS